MSWFYVDDGLHQHRKALRAGAEAMGLWLMAGSWVADQLTDGFVPDYVARQHVPDLERVAGRLVDVGLWVPGECDGDRGWWMHDYLEVNKSREQVLEAREKDRQKKAAMRSALAAKRRGNSRSARPRGTPLGTPDGSPAVVPSGSPALPDPGSPPSSGTPASGGRGAGRPPDREPVHVPTSSPEVRAAARRSVKPSRRRRSRHAGPGDRPLVASVPPDVATPADPRAEQDRLAELDAVQAVSAATDERSPPTVDESGPSADPREQETA